MATAHISTKSPVYGNVTELTLEYLEREHVKLRKPAQTIAKQIGRASATVRRALRKFGLWKPVRQGEKRNLIGNEYGKLKVRQKAGRGGEADTWICDCECGLEHITSGYKLVNMMVDQCTVCAQPQSQCGSVPVIAWSEIRRGGTKRRHAFTITIEEASALFELQHKRCALSGVDISFATSCVGHKRRRETTASLDRIDSQVGYVPGNIQWVHKTVNLMKQKLTQSEFITWCKLIAEQQNDHIKDSV